MPKNLDHLSNLPPDRIVSNVAVGANIGEHGGVVVKFAFKDSSKTETLTYLRAAASRLVDGLSAAAEHGHLPPLSPEQRSTLTASIPQIEDYDWNLHGQKSRIVGGIEMLSGENSINCSFLMKDGTARRFHIPPPVAMFLGGYLYQYRDHIDGPDTRTPPGRG